MSDRNWNRQQPPMSGGGGRGRGILKRPRMEFDFPPPELSGYEMHQHEHYPRDNNNNNNHGVPQLVNDTQTIGSAYDRYLQSTLPSQANREANTYGGGGQPGRAFGGPPGFQTPEPSLMGRPTSEPMPNGQDINFMNFSRHPPIDTVSRPPFRETVPLPPDASDTLYIEGLPSDCTKREVAHIFRPFVGYKEVRLVPKSAKHRGGDPMILGFVDFINPACAATAMSALQGYQVDEKDPDSNHLRLQFSRNPGPRSGGHHPSGRR